LDTILKKQCLSATGTGILLLLCLFFFANPATGADRIRVGVPRSSPPFSFTDETGQGIRGFAVDLAVLLVGEIHRRTRFIEAEPPALREALKKREIDFISGVAIPKKDDPDFTAIETDVTMERQYFVNGNCVTVTCHQDLPGKSVAVVRGSDHLDVDLTRQDINFIEVQSELEALELVNSGQAEAYIAYSSLTAQYLIQKYHLNDIKKVGFPIEKVALSVIVPKNDTALLKKLSVAFGRILESGDYKKIRDKWLGRGVYAEFAAGYTKHIAIGLGAISVCVVLLLAWNRTLKRRVHRITNDLRVSERKYRHLIESSPEMIFLISDDGTIKLANQIALASLARSQDEVARLKLWDLVSANNRETVIDFVEKLFCSGGAQAEFAFENGDGNLRSVDTVATVVKAQDDNTSLACCFSRDITQRKRLEEELIQSERLATMGRMAAGLAHEINNPLGIILANAQDALRGGLDSTETHRILETIERNATRAGRILAKLLSFTRPSPFIKSTVELNLLVDEALFLMQAPLKRKKILVRKELGEYPVEIQGDASQIQQVLVNLLLNSIEAIDAEGGITVRLRRDGSSDSQRVSLEIEDTGVGIPGADLPKVFEPFFTARKKKGLGLGLFISKQIVEKHGGTMVAWSQQGRGTRMTIALPVQ
jgi:PAS domain S-box-containing protein